MLWLFPSLPSLYASDEMPSDECDEFDAPPSPRVFRSGTWHGVWRTLPSGACGIIYTKLHFARNDTLSGRCIDADDNEYSFEGRYNELDGTVQFTRKEIANPHNVMTFEGSKRNARLITGVWRPPVAGRKAGNFCLIRGKLPDVDEYQAIHIC